VGQLLYDRGQFVLKKFAGDIFHDIRLISMLCFSLAIMYGSVRYEMIQNEGTNYTFMKNVFYMVLVLLVRLESH
jgi:hypothetical protein